MIFKSGLLGRRGGAIAVAAGLLFAVASPAQAAVPVLIGDDGGGGGGGGGDGGGGGGGGGGSGGQGTGGGASCTAFSQLSFTTVLTNGGLFANDVAVGADGSVWMIGGGGVQMVLRGSSIPASLPGFFTSAPPADISHGRIAVGPDGSPWVVSTDRNIYHLNLQTLQWQQLPGQQATDIGVGADGAVWITGNDSVTGGFGVWEFTGGSWLRVAGSGLRISVNAAGQPVVANSSDKIFQRNADGSWTQAPTGLATDISVGANGSVWVIGTTSTGSGANLYEQAGSGWTQDGRITASGVAVAVDPCGEPFLTDSSGFIHALE